MARPLEILGLDKNFENLDAKSAAIAKLDILAENVDEALALRKSNGLLHRAVKAWNKGRVARTGQLAFEATNVCPENPAAYLVLGIALEKMGFLYKALVTYEQAYKLAPEYPEVVINLSQLAKKFHMMDVAEKLCRDYISKVPDEAVGYNNLAGILSETDRVDQALDVLQSALERLPNEAILWNTLATVLAEEGRVEESIVFYREAIRLTPSCTRYYHNLGYAFMHLEKIDEAIDLYAEALEHVTDPIERLESKYSRSVCLIQVGRLEEGFSEYEVRNNPRFRGYTKFVLAAPHWEGEPLAGKRFLAVGEQGLGDEIMFANVLPDVLRDIGPDGKLCIAVEPRLVSLFQRSFPDAEVGRYDDRVLKEADGDHELRYFPFLPSVEKIPNYYAVLGTALQYYRRKLEDFPHKPYLVPDPERVAHFRSVLNQREGEILVGICWRSMMLSHKRGKYYSSLDMWGPIFRTPGVRFVNLQYGDCEKELAEAEAQFGIKIERMPDLDLTQDIDGNAALSAAVDLVISAPTSVAAISGAVGTETWFLLSNNGWPQLGTSEYPWYAKSRTFASERFAVWDEAIVQIAEALKTFRPRR